MLNHITIMGRLTRDPELRMTQSQAQVASFTLAVDRDFGGRDGGEKQTDFIDCVAWRQTAEFVSKYPRQQLHERLRSPEEQPQAGRFSLRGSRRRRRRTAVLINRRRIRANGLR